LRQAAARYPSAFGYLLSALDFYLSQPKEIAIVGELDSHEVRSFVQTIYSRYIPNKVVAACQPGDLVAEEAIRLLAGRPALDGRSTAYVCRNYTCLEPATSSDELALRLDD
jgi:hypothetical protein